jgi:DNA-binding response OmpR family regulator
MKTVARPFVYDELLARICAVLRRSNGPRHPRLTVRDLEIDVAPRVVTLAGETVQLSAKEYELLVALAEDSGLGDPDPHFAAEREITVSAIAVTPVPAEAAA